MNRRYIAGVAVLALLAFGYLPRFLAESISVEETYYISCDVPNEMDGTDISPLVEQDNITCEMGIEASQTTSRFMGYRESTETTRQVQLQGSISQIAGPLLAGGTELDERQVSGCLQSLERRILGRQDRPIQRTSSLIVDDRVDGPESFNLTCIPRNQLR